METYVINIWYQGIVSGTLRLTREGIGIELRRGTFEILVDDKNVGSIEWHETVEMPLAPGPHALRIRKGRFSSPSRSFDIGDGDVANFTCHGSMVWPRWLLSFVVPGLGISLRRH
jgi:hypothetical protein